MEKCKGTQKSWFAVKQFSELLTQAALDDNNFEDLKKFIDERRKCELINWGTFTAFESLFDKKTRWAKNFRAVEIVMEAFCYIVRQNRRWDNEREWLTLTINVFKVLNLLPTQDQQGEFIHIIFEKALPTIGANIRNVWIFVVKEMMSWLSRNECSYSRYLSALISFEKFLIDNEEALTEDFKCSIMDKVVVFSDIIGKVGDYGIQLTVLSIIQNLTGSQNMKGLFPSLPRSILNDFKNYTCDELLDRSRKFLNLCNSQPITDILSVYFLNLVCGGQIIIESGGWVTLNKWSDSIKIYSIDDKLLLDIPMRVLIDYDLKAVPEGFRYEIQTKGLKMIREGFLGELIIGTALLTETSDEIFQIFHSCLREIRDWQVLRDFSQTMEELHVEPKETTKTNASHAEVAGRDMRISNGQLANWEPTSLFFLSQLMPRSPSSPDCEGKEGPTLAKAPEGKLSNGSADGSNEFDDSECIYLGTFEKPRDEDNLLTLAWPVKIEKNSEEGETFPVTLPARAPLNSETTTALEREFENKRCISSPEKTPSHLPERNSTNRDKDCALTISSRNTDIALHNISMEESSSFLETNGGSFIASKRSSSLEEIPETPTRESSTSNFSGEISNVIEGRESGTQITLNIPKDNGKHSATYTSSNLAEKTNNVIEGSEFAGLVTSSIPKDNAADLVAKKGNTTRKRLYSPQDDSNGIAIEEEITVLSETEHTRVERSYRFFKSKRSIETSLDKNNSQNIYDFPESPRSGNNKDQLHLVPESQNVRNSRSKNRKNGKKNIIAKKSRVPPISQQQIMDMPNGVTPNHANGSENWLIALKNATTERSLSSTEYRCNYLLNHFLFQIQHQIQLFEKDALLSLDQICLNETSHFNSAVGRMLQLATKSENSLKYSISALKSRLTEIAISQSCSSEDPREKMELLEKENELNATVQAKERLLEEFNFMIRENVEKYKQKIMRTAEQLKLNLNLQ